MEVTLPDYTSVQYLPSEIAAAALCLSLKLIDNSEWVRHKTVTLLGRGFFKKRVKRLHNSARYSIKCE